MNIVEAVGGGVNIIKAVGVVVEEERVLSDLSSEMVNVMTPSAFEHDSGSNER